MFSIQEEVGFDKAYLYGIMYKNYKMYGCTYHKKVMKLIKKFEK